MSPESPANYGFRGLTSGGQWNSAYQALLLRRALLKLWTSYSDNGRMRGMVGCDERRERRQDGNTPHPNPLLRTPVAEFVACRRTPLPPKGEARNSVARRPDDMRRADRPIIAVGNRSYGHAVHEDGAPVPCQRTRAGRLWRSVREGGERNVPFYQTNPPFFGGFFVANCYEDAACTGNRREKSVGSFSKTNPPGEGFGGVRGRKWDK